MTHHYDVSLSFPVKHSICDACLQAHAFDTTLMRDATAGCLLQSFDCISRDVTNRANVHMCTNSFVKRLASARSLTFCISNNTCNCCAFKCYLVLTCVSHVQEHRLHQAVSHSKPDWQQFCLTWPSALL